MSKIKKELYERENQEIIEHTKFQIWVGGLVPKWKRPVES